jgi:hypothetical protein
LKINVILIAVLVVLLFEGCMTLPSPTLNYSAAVRDSSYADDQLFYAVIHHYGGVGYMDEELFPNATVRTITRIDAEVPYDIRTMGLERWTIQHDGKDSCSYIIKFTPDGYNGSVFQVWKDTSGMP